MVKGGIWSALHCSNFLPWNGVLCYIESGRVIHSKSSFKDGSGLRAIDLVDASIFFCKDRKRGLAPSIG